MRKIGALEGGGTKMVLAVFTEDGQELERISIAVETLQLWCERMLDTGAIDQAQYEAYKKSKQ